MVETEGAVVKYDQTPDSKFYACRECDTHIVLSDSVEWALPENVVVKNPVNLKTDASESENLSEYVTTVIARCAGCNTALGDKFVRVDPHHDFYSPGDVTLTLRKLLFWDGNQMLDAFTKLPIPTNDPAGQ